jgi:IS1 family transposase
MHTGAIGKGMSLDARGKFGYSGGFGRIAFGYNRFGLYTWYAGIYQKLYLWGKPYISRKKFAWGDGGHSEIQVIRRGVFADAVSAWQALDSDQKNVFKKRAKNLPMSGYNLFLKEWLFSH